MKKLIALALTLIMVLSLAACGSSKDNSEIKTDEKTSANAESTIDKELEDQLHRLFIYDVDRLVSEEFGAMDMDISLADILYLDKNTNEYLGDNEYAVACSITVTEKGGNRQTHTGTIASLYYMQNGSLKSLGETSAQWDN